MYRKLIFVLLFGFIFAGCGEDKNDKFIFDGYYLATEEMPEPIGGINAIASNIVYPAEAKENGVEGRVYVRVYVNEEGDVDKTEILKGIGYGCDEAAADAVMKTKFKPGKQKGVAVKTKVSIPIVFSIK